MRITIKVYGLVQGVFFRQETKKKADELGLAGYVKNEPDGAVLIAAEGQKKSLEKLIEWCKIGPPLAKVKKIEVRWNKNTDGFKDFSIRY